MRPPPARLVAAALGLALALIAGPARAEGPARVVSINLCTDQLAMLVAGPGQLVSVSHLSRDPRVSAMTDEAAALPVNHGLAEDILRLRPDLVLASAYSAPATLDMLRRLDLPVQVFDPEEDLQDIRDNLDRMGRLLGRQDRARAVIARFDADLAALAEMPSPGGRAALYGANGYSSGDLGLAGVILSLAGLESIASELGLPHGGFLPLEDLVMADPDLVVGAARYPGASRAEEVLDHPALRAVTAGRAAISGGDWVCGTPHVLRAAARLREDAQMREDAS